MDEKLPFCKENDPFFRLGFERAISRGARSVAIEIASRMKEDNMPIDQISRCTKLSIEEIEKLYSQFS